jgi:hypothetical protein
MAKKTYVPTFQFFWLHFSYKYATRWQTKLEANLSSACYTALLEWIAKTAELLICLGSPPA